VPNMIHKQELDLEQTEAGPHGEHTITLKLPKRSEILAVRQQEVSSRVYVWYSFPAGEEEMIDTQFYCIMTGRQYAGPPVKDSSREYPESHLQHLATTFHKQGTIVLHWFLNPHLYVMKAL